MTYNYLFTIAIPTYNRAEYLDVCLQQISKQINLNVQGLLEVIVSDNASTDNTKIVVDKYIENGLSIKYIINKSNVGPDKNIAQCFCSAQGKYVLILGDDDVLVDGALDKIIAVLKENEYGLVYLNAYGFKKDFVKEKPKRKYLHDIVYEDKENFLKKVSYYITFISGNICNKSCVDINLEYEKYLGTYLVQVAWYISAVLRSESNLYIQEPLIATKIDNTGGYKLFKVFGVNFNKILFFYKTKGLNKNVINSINNDLLKTFFPVYILKVRINENGAFKDKSKYEDLFIQYKNNVIFWIFVVPIMKLPVPLAKCYIKLVILYSRLRNFFL